MSARLILVLFGVLGVLGAACAFVWLVAAAIVAPKGNRAWNIILSFDQLLNSTTGGSPDETVSSRAGRLRKEKKVWACVLCRLLDAVQKGHCENSIGV